MNKIQLFTNGDSNTFGSELLTNNSWPVMLSKKLNCTVDNYAFPGSSNDKIIRETTDYVVNNLNNADNLIVVLGFTEMSRIEFFSDELNSWIQIANAHIDAEDKIKQRAEEYEAAIEKLYLEPDDAHSTELGEVPQEPEKGSLRPGYYYTPLRYRY